LEFRAISQTKVERIRRAMSRVVGSIVAKGVAWSLALYLMFVTLGPQSVRPHVGPADAERFAAFFVTAAAFVVAYPRRPVLVAVGSVVFAIALELAQFLAPGRDPGVRDAIAKSVGGVCGTAIAFLVLTQLRLSKGK
jgi:VanZ family protein